MHCPLGFLLAWICIPMAPPRPPPPMLAEPIFCPCGWPIVLDYAFRRALVYFPVSNL